MHRKALVMEIRNRRNRASVGQPTDLQEGNYDLVGLNFPVFFVRDPMQGPDNIRSQQRNPENFLLDYSEFHVERGRRGRRWRSAAPCTLLLIARAPPDRRSLQTHGSTSCPRCPSLSTRV